MFGDTRQGSDLRFRRQNASRVFLTDSCKIDRWDHSEFTHVRRTHQSVWNKLERDKSPAVLVIFRRAEISPEVIQSFPEYLRLRIRAKRIGVYAYIGVAEKSQEKSQEKWMWALAPASYATLATAAARCAMWHASKWPERERMSQNPEGRASATCTAESGLNQETG
jgi:hypothetical protein